MTADTSRPAATIARVSRDLAWATSVIGALFAAATVIHLIQLSWRIDLQWGFDHFVSFYRAAIVPVVDFVQWPLRLALDALSIDVRIPAWLKDLHTLSFVLAGLYVRGWSQESKAMAAYRLASAPENPSIWHRASLERARKDSRIAPQDAALQIALALALGFTGLSFAAWVYTLSKLPFTHSDRYWDERSTPFAPVVGAPLRALEDRFTRFRFGNLVRTTSITMAAVALFYVTNALLPQLG